MAEKIYTAELDKSGRILIPAVLRKEFGWEPGEKINFVQRDDDLVLHTHKAALKKIQALTKKIADEYYSGQSLVDLLIKERREEAVREDGE